MNLFRRILQQRHCAHVKVRGIYGDEINITGGYRVQCRECGAFLDGPVSIAVDRQLLERKNKS